MPPGIRADSDTRPAAQDDPDVAAGKQAIARKEWGRAIESFNKAAAKDGRNADIQNFLGYAYRNSGQMDFAFKYYAQALALDPRHRGAHEYVGEAYLMVKNLAKAEEHLAALNRLCFFPCEEYTDLKRKVETYKSNVG
jgi:Flp pilus assembly protein TadD